MRNKIIRLFILIIALGLISFTVFSLINNWNEIKNLNLENPLLLLAIVPFLSLNIFATGKLFDIAIKAHGVRMSNIDSFGLAALARFGNYISFGQAGFALRVFYLLKKHSMKLTDSISGLGVSNLIFYLTITLVALFSVVFLIEESDASNSIGLVGALFIGLLVLIVLLSSNIDKFVKSKFLSPLLTPFKNFFLSTNKVVRSKNTVALSFFWSVVMLLTFTFMLKLEFAVLGADINFIDSLFLTSVSSLTGLINITPAGLGINEGLLLIAGKAIGTPADLLLAAAIIRRVIVFTFVLLVSIYFSKSIFNLKLTSLLSRIKDISQKQKL